MKNTKQARHSHYYYSQEIFKTQIARTIYRSRRWRVASNELTTHTVVDQVYYISLPVFVLGLFYFIYCQNNFFHTLKTQLYDCSLTLLYIQKSRASQISIDDINNLVFVKIGRTLEVCTRTFKKKNVIYLFGRDRF